ncbi:hypothetical protein [Coleofasciculus sp.]|uniref:hypothetical protein n=1 Tax=Coleofasciculus sp. TaxID=3100458 RepID=UPI003A2FC3AC
MHRSFRIAIALPPPTHQTPNSTAFQVSGKVAIASSGSKPWRYCNPCQLRVLLGEDLVIELRSPSNFLSIIVLQ